MSQRTSEHPRRERDLGSMELWSMAGVAVVMPKYNPAWSLGLRAAWRRRLWANLTGRCECGGELRSVGVSAFISHSADCPASDERLRPMLEAES